MSLEKIDIRNILKDQLRTLVDDRTGRLMKSDLLVHFGIPIAVFGASLKAGLALSKDSVGLAVTALAVVASLLFNLLVSASGLRMANRGSVIFGAAKELSKQILVNIEYTILLAFAAIAVVMPSLLPAPSQPSWLVDVNSFAQKAVAPAFLALLTAFALSMLMVLRRMHVALTKNLEVSYESAPLIETRETVRQGKKAG